MIKIAAPVIAMTEAELSLIIESAVKKGVDQAMKSFGQMWPHRSEKEKRVGGNTKWVRAERYIEISGEPINTILDRIRDGVWAAGKHYKRTGPRTLWINLEEVEEWVSMQPHVEAAMPTNLRSRKSGVAE